MPAIGVAALALFAALYLYYPYTYEKVMTAIITLPGWLYRSLAIVQAMRR
jgi:hypothetical protein